VNLPVSYFTIEEKNVGSTPIEARILDISRQGKPGPEKFADSLEFTYMDDSTSAAMALFVNHLV